MGLGFWVLGGLGFRGLGFRVLGLPEERSRFFVPLEPHSGNLGLSSSTRIQFV